jgi:hypothetical protein
MLSVEMRSGQENLRTKFGALSMDYVSPHIKWAHKLDGGPIKTIIIAPVWSQRETVELAQRIAIKPLPVMITDYDKFVPSELEKPVLYLGTDKSIIMKDARAKFDNDFDLIIIGKIKWDAFPPLIKSIIISSVKQGKGLIYICPDDTSLKQLLPNITPKSLPQDSFIPAGLQNIDLLGLNDKKWNEIVRIAKLGKGRIAIISYPQNNIDYDKFSKSPIRPLQSLTSSFRSQTQPLSYEFYMSFLGRVILWAANREPENFITSIHFPSKIIREKLSLEKLDISWDASKTKSRTLIVEMRNDKSETGDVLFKKDFNLKDKKGNILIPVPIKLSPGKYYINAWLKTKNNILDWHSKEFNVLNSPSYKKALKSIKLSRDFLVSGEDFNGKIELSAKIPQDYQLNISIYDFYKRCLWQKTIKPVNDEKIISFSGKILFLKSLSAEIRVSILDREGNIVEQISEKIPVQNVDISDDFEFLMWSNPHASKDVRPLSMALSAYSSYGITADYDPTWTPNPDETVINHNLKLAPILWRTTVLQDKCLSDEKHRDVVKKYLKEKALKYKSYAPLLLSLGDETFHWGGVSDHLDCPLCVAKYRLYLKRIFKNDIIMLNKKWNSDYKNFDEIKFITFEKLKKNQQVAQWISQATFFQWLFADFYKCCFDSLKTVCPKAFVGDEGSVNLKSGTAHEISTLWAFCDIVQSYGNIDMIRSFARKPSLRGIWVGNYPYGRTDDDYMKSLSWRHLFMGMNSVWWWKGFPAEGSDFSSALTPDLMPIPAFKYVSDNIKEIRNGISTLLLKASTPCKESVAVLFSPASTHAAAIIDGNKGEVSLAMKDFATFFSMNNINIRYILEKDIVNGNLIKNKYSLLILPSSYVLSDDEISQIFKFMKNGGWVIADKLPGILDEYGFRRSDNPFDEQFGKLKSLESKDLGKGKFIIIQNALNGLSGKEKDSSIGAKELSALLDQKIKILRPVDIVDSKNQFIPDVCIRLFQENNALYAGIDRDINNMMVYQGKGGEQKVKITFPNKGNIYDVRKRKFLCYGSTIETNLGYRPELFAILPYKVENVQIDNLNGSYKQRDDIQIDLSIKTSSNSVPVNHVFHIEIINPSGKSLVHFKKNIVSLNGKAHLTIPLAFNDPAGKYKIVVSDVATGVFSEKDFNIEVKK